MKKCHYHLCQMDFNPSNPRTRFCSKSCANIFRVNKRRITLKLLALDYLGGCCSGCGYNKSIDALEFHHKNPSEKEFGISSGNTRAWENVKGELDKCIVLCANCHRELHENLKATGYILVEAKQDLFKRNASLAGSGNLTSP